MTTPPVHVERRAGQRFTYNLPVSLYQPTTGGEGLGFTQDLSSRGVFFFTDMQLGEGVEIELTLQMPSEITLGESMRVRCRGRVLRVVKPTDASLSASEPAQARPSETKISQTKISQTKIGVAVCMHGYEYLPDADDSSATFRRIAALHTHLNEEQPAEPSSLRPQALAR
jgi:hypothetical protein